MSARFGVGPIIVHGLILTALAWQAFGLIGGPVWMATLLLGLAMLMFDFGGVLYGINYLALRQAITPDRLLGPHDGDDALSDRGDGAASDRWSAACSQPASACAERC